MSALRPARSASATVVELLEGPDVWSGGMCASGMSADDAFPDLSHPIGIGLSLGCAEEFLSIMVMSLHPSS